MGSFRISILLYYFVAIIFYNEVSALSIVESGKDTFATGTDLKVTCNANAVDVPQDNALEFYSIKLSRKTYSANAADDKYIIYSLNYRTLLLSPNKPYQTIKIPSGKDWDLEYPTETTLRDDNNRFKRDIMSVTATLKDASCEDSGHYFCAVTYGTGVDDLTKEESQAVNGTVMASGLKMTVSPDNAFGALEATYEANTTIDMLCTADAPTEYKFYWSRQCPNRNSNFNFNPNWIEWLPQNDIQAHDKELIINQNGRPNECGVYRHSQRLIFKMEKDYDDCMIKCEFGLSRFDSDNINTNFTVRFRDDTVTPDPGNPGGSKSSSASNEDLVIGLTVSLLLVAVIVVAVLLYVCWWRKRTPADKYKDEPDVGRDNNSTSAPPVFYSKPHKPPKDDLDAVEDGGTTNKGLDHSYDSRDSGGRGGGVVGDDDYRPPRYVNHEPISSGPPTYNSHDEPPYHDPRYDEPPLEDIDLGAPRDVPRSREPYRGHQNTAYDGDGGEPQPEGRRYQRGRARSNRGERLNSSRSTEDGSHVVHGLGPGDANMGTAI